LNSNIYNVFILFILAASTLIII